MSALRLPVEAERCKDRFGETFWIVGDAAGRVPEDESLNVAFERLAERQRTELRGRPEIPNWPARIAEEKAKWSERAFLDEVGLTTDIGDPAFASRYALSLAALAGTLPLAGQRRRGDEDAQDHALDVASAEAVRTYVQPERYVPLTLMKERQ